jgi:hypothetical protein
VRTLRKTAQNGYRSFVAGTFLYKQHVMRFGSSPQWTTLAIVASKSSNTFHGINFRFSCNILFDPMQSSNACGLKLQTCAVAPHWGNVDFTEWEIAVCLDFPFTQATWKTTIQWLYNDYTVSGSPLFPLFPLFPSSYSLCPLGFWTSTITLGWEMGCAQEGIVLPAGA